MQYCTLGEQLYLNRRLAQNMEQSSFGKAEGQEDSTELMEICWHGRHHRCRRAVIMVPRLTSGRVWLWSQRAVCTVCHSSGSRAWINEARFHKDRYMANLPTHVHGKIRMDSTMNDAENTSMASWHVLDTDWCSNSVHVILHSIHSIIILDLFPKKGGGAKPGLEARRLLAAASAWYQTFAKYRGLAVWGHRGYVHHFIPVCVSWRLSVQILLKNLFQFVLYCGSLPPVSGGPTKAASL